MNDFVLYDEKEVEKKNGYPAKYIIDYKGLAGDASDNITGVPGIGDTFAKRLIAAFGGLDAIYKALDDGKLQEAGFTKRIETLLTDGKEHAFTSRDLATIHTDVPVRVPHNDVKPWKEMIVYADARETLERYSFESLFARLDAITGRSGDEKGADTAQPEDKMVKDAESPIAKEAAIMLWVLDASQTNAGSDDVRTHTRTEDYNDATKILLVIFFRYVLLSFSAAMVSKQMPVFSMFSIMGISGFSIFSHTDNLPAFRRLSSNIFVASL